MRLLRLGSLYWWCARADPTIPALRPGEVEFTCHRAGSTFSSLGRAGVCVNPPLFLRQVLFKLLLGSAKFGEAALFLSILGVFNILFVTCIPVILYFTKVEYWSSFSDIPWGSLCGFSVLLLSKWPPSEPPESMAWQHRTPAAQGLFGDPRPEGENQHGF